MRERTEEILAAAIRRAETLIATLWQLRAEARRTRDIVLSLGAERLVRPAWGGG